MSHEKCITFIFFNSTITQTHELNMNNTHKQEEIISPEYPDKYVFHLDITLYRIKCPYYTFTYEYICWEKIIINNLGRYK